jgi:hypothetical protein
MHQQHPSLFQAEELFPSLLPLDKKQQNEMWCLKTSPDDNIVNKHFFSETSVF